MLVGCGAAGSSRPASAPAEPPRSHATIADAEADLARAEALLPASPGAGSSGQRSADAPSEAPERDTKKLSDKEAGGGEAAPTPCQTACRALSSMQRAAESVCRLAGDGDERCVGAKKRVENAKVRVAHCGCS